MTDAPVDIGEGRPEDRRRDTMATWRRRSRLVARARAWLPIAIGVLLAAVVGGVIVTAILGQSGARQGQQTTIRMLNPSFLGRDEANRAFVLTAKEAVRIEGSGRRVRMTDPVLTLSRDSARPTVVTAAAGDYDELSELLHLRQRVTLDSPSGKFTTEDALVDPNRRSIVGQARIVGVGPGGNIAADRYALYDGGERVLFSGNVSATLRSSSNPPPGPPAVAAAPGGEPRP